MTTTEPTATQAPYWLKLDVLLPGDLCELIREVEADAVAAYGAAKALARRVETVKAHWEGHVARTTPIEVGDIVAEISGFKRMDEALLLAGLTILDAWDAHSLPSDEHVADVRRRWEAQG